MQCPLGVVPRAPFVVVIWELTITAPPERSKVTRTTAQKTVPPISAVGKITPKLQSARPGPG